MDFKGKVTLGFWQVDVTGRLAGSIMFLSLRDLNLTPSFKMMFWGFMKTDTWKFRNLKKRKPKKLFVRAADSSGKYAGTVFFVYFNFMLLYIYAQPLFILIPAVMRKQKTVTFYNLLACTDGKHSWIWEVFFELSHVNKNCLGCSLLDSKTPTLSWPL